MAIIKTVTSDKGITTSYHRIHKIETDNKRMTITVRSYTDQAFRQAELDADASIIAAAEYGAEIERLQNEISVLIEGNADGSNTEEIQEKSDLLNQLSFDEDQPRAQERKDLHAIENEYEMEHVEALSRASLYDLLTAEGNLYAGGDTDEES